MEQLRRRAAEGWAGPADIPTSHHGGSCLGGPQRCLCWERARLLLFEDTRKA